MNLLAYALGETWAVKEDWLFGAVYHETGAIGSRRMPRPRARGSVAVIPLQGPITQRGSAFDEFFGGTSAQAFEAAFARAMQSDRVSAVVLDVDSPGGTVGGVQQAADRVFAARGTKPVVAVANSVMGSAAYWIGSQADHVVATPNSDVGSIGVFRMHQDVSEAMAKDGHKFTLIGVPEHKTESTPFAPLSDDARAHHFEQVEEKFAAFNASVARARGVSEKDARANFGRGRDFSSHKAKSVGLVDRVASMDDVLKQLGVGGSIGVTEASAEIEGELCAAWSLGLSTEVSGKKTLRRKRLDMLERFPQNCV